MPSLKQLTCYVEWSASGPDLPLQEYGTTYSDGLVETYIAIPPVPTPFAIRLKSDGYIAPGLSMFVYIDGVYQCNRGRNNLKIPDSITQKHQTNIDFVVRQKEEPLGGGGFFGRQWIFGKLEHEPNAFGPVHGPKTEYMDTIEVVVLRSAGFERAKAPDASASEKHPMAFATNSMNRGESESAKDGLGDFGGLFDGPSDDNERRSHAMPFGGDMAWDDDHRHEQNRHGHGWNTSSRSENQQQNTSKPRGRSGSVLSQPATPAIIINVSQPALGSPFPWAAAEGQPWNTAGASGKDSWASTPVPPKMDDSWQTWINGPPKPQESLQNSQESSSSSSSDAKDKAGNEGSRGKDRTSNTAWGASDHRGRSGHTQSVPGGWNTGNQNQQAQDNGRGWKDQGRNSENCNAPQYSPQQGNPDWNNNAKDGSYNRQGGSGWNNTGKDDGNHQEHWNTGGSNNNNQNDNGWANGGNNENWNAGQDDQGNWDSNGNHQDAGDWNADQDHSQGDKGWNGNGQEDNDYGQGNNGYDLGNYNDSGKDWNNANTGAQEPQAPTGQDWNRSGNQQGDLGKTGGAKDTLPATAGGFDPTKPGNRRAPSGKAKRGVMGLSKQASINSAARRSGWPPSGPHDGNHGEPSNTVPKSFGPPGAWPEIPQAAAGMGPSKHGPDPLTKPYHVTLDVAGNPRLPPVPDFARAPTPPLPPTADLPFRVRRGEPALYQHKVASPKYMDTHDKPYAVFIFRYGSKDVVEQMLNISIPQSEDVEKAKLASLSKEELIAEVIKSKVRSGRVQKSRYSLLKIPQSRTGSKADPSSTSSLPSVPPSVNNFAHNGNDFAGPSGGSFGAALNDKLAALAAPEKEDSSSSSGSKNELGRNHAPPGSPIANNGNATFGGPLNGHAPTPPKWAAPNSSNWNENAALASEGGGGGGHVETWLDKTPAGASVIGHKPWGGNVKNSGGGSKTGGSMKNPSRNENDGNRGGSQKGGSMKNPSWNGNDGNREGSQKGGGGGWQAGNKRDSSGRNGWQGGNDGGSGQEYDWGNAHIGGGASQKAGSWNNHGGGGSHSGNWKGNNGGNNGDGAVGNTNGNEKAGGDEPEW
ncbi:MAG: hypothetical protein Q9196_001332 [Gyalolechia fulgens]